MSKLRYPIGFALSVLLTLGAFWVVYEHQLTHHVFPTHGTMTAVLIGLALMQLVVQLTFFLHPVREYKRWNYMLVACTLAIVVFVVGGTLWIMSNLQSQHDTPYSGTPSPQTELD